MISLHEGDFDFLRHLRHERFVAHILLATWNPNFVSSYFRTQIYFLEIQQEKHDFGFQDFVKYGCLALLQKKKILLKKFRYGKE